MENQIEIFKNEELGDVRTLFIDGECWFVAKDVAVALGYKEPLKAIRDHIYDDEKGVTKMDTPGGKQDVVILNESGLYNLIFSSKLETAQNFRKWVTHEVLPSIRKHGIYITDELLQDNDRLQNKITELQMENKLKDSKINELEEVRTEYMKQRDKIFKIQIKSGNDNGSFIPYCILQLVREFIKDPDNIEYKDDDIIKVNSRKLIKFAKRLFPKNHDAQYYLSTCLDIKAWDKCSIISTKILREDYEPIQDILY